MRADTKVHEELGFYTLAGQPGSSRELVTEVVEAEALGLGTAFISERYNKKEAATLSGAAGAVSERITIATAATNHNTRHPMVTAAFARTMQSLTGGRFVLGIGRGIASMQDAYGIGRITTAQIEDFAGLMRRLFRGEVIVGHNGPAGSWPVLHLDAQLDEHLPMGLVAFGANSLALGGRCYLQGYGDLLVRTNGWDHKVLERFLADPVMSSVRGLDVVGTTEQLAHAATLIPDEWLAPAATGTPAQCVAAIRNQLDLGCDGVIMHGATPSELAPIVAEYRSTLG